MHYLERKNGYVFLVQEDSNDGRFKTYYNMGKDPDELDKPKKTTKKEDDK